MRKNNGFSLANSKLINAVLYLLIFLCAVNFLGKVSSIAICFCAVSLLFVNNKNAIKFDWYFLLLIIFCACFYIFCLQIDYTSGLRIFCCLGMYMVGIKLPIKEKGMRFLLCFISFSMCAYLLLNFIYEYSNYGSSMMKTYVHYDFWSKSQTSTTGLMANATLFVSLLFFVFFINKKLIVKVIYFIMLIGTFGYNVIVGGRSLILILLLTLLLSFLFCFLSKEKEAKNSLKSSLLFFIIALVIVYFIIAGNMSFISEKLQNTNLFRRIEYSNYFDLLNDGRWVLRSLYFSYFWIYPFGGNKIRTIVGQQPHELWLEVFDLGGIVPYVLLVIITLFSLLFVIKYLRRSSDSFKTKLIIFSSYVGIILQFAIEPVYTGMPFIVFLFFFITGYCKKRTIEHNQRSV